MANNFLRLAKGLVCLGAQKGAKGITWLDNQAARAADSIEASIASSMPVVKSEPKRPESDADTGKGSE